MPEHTCATCGKTFKTTHTYTVHQARKRPCKPPQSTQPANTIHYESPTPSPASVVKPFLKWVGGKTQILDDVLALFPTTIAGNYHEPFLGGGSVLLGFLSHVKRGTIKHTGKVYASDLNANLIALYKNIQTNPEAVIAETKSLIDTFSKCTGTIVNRAASSLDEAMTSHESYYYWIRKQFNALTGTERTSAAASAMMLFLNKTCFRGVYREGPSGFNVPYGNYKNPSVLDEVHIRNVSILFRDVEFTVAAFTESLARTESGDFVYMDPPYAPETTTSFVSYTADGFGLDAHNQLFKMCSELKDKGVQFLMSNANVSLVKDAFPAPKYDTKIIPCRRAIHSKTPDAMTNEVLITN
jgi:DNA adenine methylase